MSVLIGSKRLTMLNLKRKKKEDVLLLSYVEKKHGEKEEVWFLDSGCNNHMSGNKEWFSNLDDGFRHTVKLGNDSRMEVMGK